MVCCNLFMGLLVFRFRFGIILVVIDEIWCGVILISLVLVMVCFGVVMNDWVVFLLWNRFRM